MHIKYAKCILDKRNKITENINYYQEKRNLNAPQWLIRMQYDKDTLGKVFHYS